MEDLHTEEKKSNIAEAITDQERESSGQHSQTSEKTCHNSPMPSHSLKGQKVRQT